jgi:hypothetical protein
MRNKENIDIMMPFIDNIDAARHIMYKAKRELEIAEKAYKFNLDKLFGKDNYEITNIYCMAAVMNCVYTPNNVNRGIGHRKCIYCGGDDFDF